MKTGNVIQYLGIGIILISLIYMIMNLSNADCFITKWFLSIITGVSLSIWGTVSLMIGKKQNKG
ncbi:hypothetical protein GGR06_002789 [Bacteroides reticulotermitis]|uniref:Uncharacterized protein n=1 Tax=Bacteroides reticulotermitis TaxID=1133319 RepID=A0A840CY09_9BACE|nr:hypothetical protein [Bacteroides reticulotermitis]